ncbi:MAG: hypothetical protein J6D08_17380 [Lachnospiraceae bacterium]|nr:hypothetical protein [Lachnospiraceae bacterium]
MYNINTPHCSKRASGRYIDKPLHRKVFINPNSDTGELTQDNRAAYFAADKTKD